MVLPKLKAAARRTQEIGPIAVEVREERAVHRDARRIEARGEPREPRASTGVDAVGRWRDRRRCRRSCSTTAADRSRSLGVEAVRSASIVAFVRRLLRQYGVVSEQHGGLSCGRSGLGGLFRSVAMVELTETRGARSRALTIGTQLRSRADLHSRAWQQRSSAAADWKAARATPHTPPVGKTPLGTSI
jgi:hypothetical protein